MSFFVMRHGESIWNKENKFTGWTDIGLSEKGEQEAIIAGEKLKKINFDHIICSDLIRTKQTADLVIKNKSDFNSEKYTLG